MNETVFIVVGETGSYPDSQWWIVRVFTNKADADPHCAKLNDWCLEKGVHRNSKLSTYTQMSNRVKDGKCPLDTLFQCDWTTGTHYYVSEVPLNFANDNRELPNV